MTTVGVIIKGKRRFAGLTQDEIAQQLGISQAAVCRWETDSTVPKGRYLLPLMKILNISLADFSEAQPCQPPEK